MAFSVTQFVDRYLAASDLRRRWDDVCDSALGLWEDFWKDGHWEKNEGLEIPKPVRRKREPEVAIADPLAFNPFSRSDNLKKGDVWHALPGEVSERMWGRDNVTPADDYLTERLIGPLGLNKNMSILDLSAGLGSRLRHMTEHYGVYITGLEPDPEIALRGMALSVAAGKGKHIVIEHYKPMELSTPRKYDCVIARETIYRVDNKQKFIALVMACCKPKAQISFTDYVVNPEHLENPHIKAWMAAEKGANPASLVEMAELWAKAGVNLRTHDDLTDYYKTEVKMGMGRFADFMASGIQPDSETKAAIAKRISVWAHRMAAIEHGMKFYRFYGLK